MLTKAPRGTRDILPGEIEKWQYIENIFKKLCRQYSYREIRTPVFEHTELFSRSVGEDTDIVGKEMYTFLDKGKRSITLRPEGTASVVRAFLENKLYAQAQPTKLFYYGPMFRYDRPQAGRYRQFYQLGAEAFGSYSAEMDAELISLSVDFFNSLGLKDVVLEINSVGCPQCRAVYKKEIQKFLSKVKNKLCRDCSVRFETNPLRILDCKEDKCREITLEVPDILKHLCGECDAHFVEVTKYLELLNISYKINPRLVRGLDYYTRTAFEIVDPLLGSQNSLGGGGRYDELVEICGGNPTPGVGFAIGIDRVVLALENKGIELESKEVLKVYVAAVGEKANMEGMRLAAKLRHNGLTVEKDYLGRSLKAQMKHADRVAARYVIILGDEEIEKRRVIVRDMKKGDQKEIEIDNLVNTLKEINN